MTFDPLYRGELLRARHSWTKGRSVSSLKEKELREGGGGRREGRGEEGGGGGGRGGRDRGRWEGAEGEREGREGEKGGRGRREGGRDMEGEGWSRVRGGREPLVVVQLYVC